MITIHSAPLKRRYMAPLMSGGACFIILLIIALIIGAFLIAYFTHGEDAIFLHASSCQFIIPTISLFVIAFYCRLCFTLWKIIERELPTIYGDLCNHDQFLFDYRLLVKRKQLQVRIRHDDPLEMVFQDLLATVFAILFGIAFFRSWITLDKSLYQLQRWIIECM